MCSNVTHLYHAEPSDASVPQPSLRSTGSHSSLNTPSTQSADESLSEVHAAEDNLEEDESAFDEEGILFGDSKINNYMYTLFPQLKHVFCHDSLLGHIVFYATYMYMYMYMYMYVYND